MPIVILLLLAILVAQIGFWDSFAAVLGAIGVIVLLVLLIVAVLAVSGWYLVRRYL